ncbi:major facilitator superfamily domain-containing protein [Xylariales sp. PMI_506]|nr:major facilitator superfamily domain-containing protein [Xylariales sp. PMI_506]
MASEKNTNIDEVAPAPSLSHGGDIEEVKNSVGQLDAAAEYLRIHENDFTDITEEEQRKVLRKIDMRLMPLMLVTITLAAVDVRLSHCQSLALSPVKIVISNAALYGMQTDTGLTGQLYSWTGSIFYFGYLISEYPSNFLLQKLPVGKFLGTSCIIWSAIVTLMATAKNPPGIMILRFLMGMLEAPLFPSCSIITVMWYKRSEQPIRTAIWFSGLSSLVTGVVSYGIGHTNTSIAAWRLLFIVLGGFTFLWSIFLTIMLPDSPVKNRFLNDREKYIAILRIKDNMTGTESKQFKLYQVREAFTDWKTWPLVVFAICINIPNGGLVTFAAQIVSGLGYSKLNTTLLGMPTGIVMTLGAWSLAYPASRFKNIRCILAACGCIIPLVCCILMMKLPRTNQQGLLASYYCFYFYWAPYVTVTALPFANTAGHTKKTTVNALMFIAYCVANIIAPQFFITAEAPNYKTGYTAIMAFLAVGICMLGVYAVGLRFENARLDKKEAELRAAGVDVDSEKEAEAFFDKTDREKVYFRYLY